MGEVYRARDRRLGREVALKVLPADLSADVDRIARFEQKRGPRPALNHPNIVTIHEIGLHGDTSYISMELVRREDGARAHGIRPMPIRKLFRYRGGRWPRVSRGARPRESSTGT